MNGEKYVELLKEEMAIHIHINKTQILMYDSATCHRSQKVQNYLTTAKVTTLEWPGNTSDLNPMENQWEILKRKVADKQPSSARALIKNVFKNIYIEYCQNLISSTPHLYSNTGQRRT